MKALTVVAIILGVVFLFSLGAGTAFGEDDCSSNRFTIDNVHGMDCQQVSVPESGTLVLLGAGLAGVIVARRRMK